jgi:NAD(P)-dependent dehydrogenase (short-subunit alcohol dehydrogenase family)
VDVREESGLRRALTAGAQELGTPHIVIANAGIAPVGGAEHPDAYRDVIDVNLTGVFNTVQVATPSMIADQQGGAIVITGSTAGLNGIGGSSPGGLGYTASKHALVGLMRSYANNLAPHRIRVNIVHPAGVATPMIMNDVVQEWLRTKSAFERSTNALPVQVVEPSDITNAILWLVTSAGRYVTGTEILVDAGFTNKK